MLPGQAHDQRPGSAALTDWGRQKGPSFRREETYAIAPANNRFRKCSIRPTGDAHACNVIRARPYWGTDQLRTHPLYGLLNLSILYSIVQPLWPCGQGCIGREGASEAAPEAVRQAVGGGCRSG